LELNVWVPLESLAVLLEKIESNDAVTTVVPLERGTLARANVKDRVRGREVTDGGKELIARASATLQKPSPRDPPPEGQIGTHPSIAAAGKDKEDLETGPRADSITLAIGTPLNFAKEESHLLCVMKYPDARKVVV